VAEAGIDVVERYSEGCEVWEPFEDGIETAVFYIREVAEFDGCEAGFEVLEEGPDAVVV
jgi:hypothetical protein